MSETVIKVPEQARKTAYENLDMREKRFVDAYTGQANGSACQAALLAGFATIQSGHDLTQRPRVIAAIDEIYAAFTARSAEIRYRLTEAARGAHADYLRQKPGERVEIDTQGMIADGRGWLIRKVKNGKHGQEIEFVDQLRALEILGKGTGALKDTPALHLHLEGGAGGALERLNAGMEALRAALAGQVPAVPDTEAIDAEFVVEDEEGENS